MLRPGKDKLVKRWIKIASRKLVDCKPSVTFEDTLHLDEHVATGNTACCIQQNQAQCEEPSVEDDQKFKETQRNIKALIQCFSVH